METIQQVQPSFNLMETQQQYYGTPIVSTDRGGRRRAGMVINPSFANVCVFSFYFFKKSYLWFMF